MSKFGEIEALQDRLKRAEGRLQLLLVLSLLALVLMILVGSEKQAISQPTVIRARAIEINDAAGRERIWMGLAPAGHSVIRLSDAQEVYTSGLV